MESELLALTQSLLDAVSKGDWRVYEDLCDPGLTCFEPEAKSQLVVGLAFHNFYFDGTRDRPRTQVTMVSPRVVRLGEDVALVVYGRLVQTENGDTLQFEETRVWTRRDGQWKLVHFHRSSNGGAT